MKTTTEAQLREWVAQGLTQREIGLLLGTHQPTVSTALRVLGIKSTSHLYKEHDVEKYLEGLSKGMTLTEICKEAGINKDTACKYLKSKGLPTSSISYLKWKAKQ